MLRTMEDNVLVAKLQHGQTNSFNYEELLQLKSAISEVNQVAELQGLVITGTGPFYSSGYDLPSIINFQTKDEAESFVHLADKVLLELFACSKPVIAAINGHCAAAGMVTAMAADYRIGINNAKIRMGMSEIKIGLPLMPAMNEILRFGLNSNSLFRDVMYFAKMYDFNEAKTLGMIDEITDSDRLVPRSIELVNELMNTPRRVFMDLKRFHRKPAVQQIITETEAFDWDELLQIVFNDDIRKVLAAVQKGMDR